jgi:ferredoxin
MIRIEVDPDCCIGSGICESLAEDIFFVGEAGVVTLVAEVVSEEREGVVTQAIARCPTGAIRIRSES